MESSFTVRRICSPSAGWPTTYAKKSTATLLISTSIAISIRPTSAWRIASCARLAATPIRRAPTHTPSKKFINAPNKAFAMVEVHYFSRIAKISIEETLRRMKQAGVDSCPGGGAEIFHPRVRRIICDHKVSGQVWLNTAKKAHEIGLPSNATMLYGHVETEEERVDHLVKLREAQDQTHGFVAFIPLAFHPDNTALAHIPKPTGYDDLRCIAVSRLMLDNFDHIKAYWIMLTPSIAQIALRFGANDLDGTVVEEKIYHDAGAVTSEFTPRAELERLIREAGRVPIERDTLYRPVDRSRMPPVPPITPPGLVSLTLSV